MTYTKRKSKPKLTSLTLVPTSKLYSTTEPSILDIAKFVTSHGFMDFRKYVEDDNHVHYTCVLTMREYLSIVLDAKDRWILDSISFHDEDHDNMLTRTLFAEYEWIQKRLSNMFSLCWNYSLFAWFGSMSDEILTPHLISMIQWLEHDNLSGLKGSVAA